MKEKQIKYCNLANDWSNWLREMKHFKELDKEVLQTRQCLEQEECQKQNKRTLKQKKRIKHKQLPSYQKADYKVEI